MTGGEVVNETSPLLLSTSSDELSSSSSPVVVEIDDDDDDDESGGVVEEEESPAAAESTAGESSRAFPVPILAEIIGARHVSPCSVSTTTTTTSSSERKQQQTFQNNLTCYCVAQFGSKRLHRTKAVPTTDGNPLWTIKQSPLFVVPVGENDWINHKLLVVTVWGQSQTQRRRTRGGRSKKIQNLLYKSADQTSSSYLFLGKVRIPAHELVQQLCHGQRVEFELVDELGRPMTSGQSQTSKLALRFRFASQADVQFATVWNTATRRRQNRIPRTVLQGCQVLPQEDQPHKATLVTELEGWEVSGAHFASAATSKWRLSRISPTKRRERKGMVRVKPSAPDPSMEYMTPTDLKAMTLEPSQTWVLAGNTSSSDQCLGRLWVEVLSCHDLPNCDYGTAVVGNQTDAFCCVMYGDAMAQTPIIDDELSPHWLPWVQRAFCFGIQHPSHMLYLAVFGYKRGVFNHVPIGRIEINPLSFQQKGNNNNNNNNNDTTEFILEYDLLPASHVFSSTSQSTAAAGRIRIRLKQEIIQPRALLLAALQPSPPIYLNCHKKASWYVAKYTACGEHDNLDAFSIPILLSYIDEITKGLLRRLFYSLDDGVKAVVFWKAPWHSCIVLLAGILMVEHPQAIPSLIVWSLAYIMLVNMSLKQQNPSPWYQCTSYWQYSRILILGGGRKGTTTSSGICSTSTTTTATTTPSSSTASTTTNTKIKAHEGWDAQCQLHEQYQQRIERDELFSKRKGQLEKEIGKLEKVSTVQTVEKNGASIMISVEVFDLLGKIQGIIGRLLHVFRTVDHIMSWERSDQAFLLTTFLLGIGLVFWFIPWAFLFKWSGRLAVVILLGPQNKLLNLYWRKYHADEEGKLRQMFEERIFRARCKQEDVSKLKAFRQIIFGKFGTAVPGLSWTPRLDRPCPESYAKVVEPDAPLKDDALNHDAPCIPGQRMHGVMIPRPYDQWQSNTTESSQIKERILCAVAELDRKPPGQQSSFASQQQDPEDACSVEEEGVEVTDVYDIEACLDSTPSPGEQGKSSSSSSSSRVDQKLHESLKGDWGVEAVDLYEEEAMFVQNSWQHMSSSSTANMLHLSNSEDSSDDGEHKIEEGEFAEAVKDAFERRQSLNRAQLADMTHKDEDCLQTKLQEEDEGEGQSEEAGCNSNGPDVANVRTFEADFGKSMAELGFETTYAAENDETSI